MSAPGWPTPARHSSSPNGSVIRACWRPRSPGSASPRPTPVRSRRASSSEAWNSKRASASTWSTGQSPRFEYSRRLISTGELERPRAMLQDLAEAAEARGDEGTKMMCLWMLGQVEWLAGRWARALEHVTRGARAHRPDPVRLTAGRGSGASKGSSRPISASSNRHAPRPARASPSPNRWESTTRSTPSACSGGSSWRWATSRRPAAIFVSCPRGCSRQGCYDPMAVVWADTIETLTALGELEQASGYLAAVRGDRPACW